MHDNFVSVCVSGERACFTRPESKAERFTYPMITPSAAVGVLKNIYWHPQFEYQIDSIEVIRKGHYDSIMRNEIKKKMSGVRLSDPISISEHRTQRQTAFLRDVSYVIHARQVMLPEFDTYEMQSKVLGIFRDRVRESRCWERPSLGMKEFVADFCRYDISIHRPVRWTEDLGAMLYGFDYKNDQRPQFFHAKIVNGVLRVPEPRGVLTLVS